MRIRAGLRFEERLSGSPSGPVSRRKIITTCRDWIQAELLNRSLLDTGRRDKDRRYESVK
jgi:hypothetical protein